MRDDNLGPSGGLGFLDTCDGTKIFELIGSSKPFDRVDFSDFRGLDINTFFFNFFRKKIEVPKKRKNLKKTFCEYSLNFTIEKITWFSERIENNIVLKCLEFFNYFTVFLGYLHINQLLSNES